MARALVPHLVRKMLIRLNWDRLYSPIISTILTTSSVFSIFHILDSSHLKAVQTEAFITNYISAADFKNIGRLMLDIKLELQYLGKAFQVTVAQPRHLP